MKKILLPLLLIIFYHQGYSQAIASIDNLKGSGKKKINPTTQVGMAIATVGLCGFMVGAIYEMGDMNINFFDPNAYNQPARNPQGIYIVSGILTGAGIIVALSPLLIKKKSTNAPHSFLMKMERTEQIFQGSMKSTEYPALALRIKL
jgi:hypothetical protein